MKIIHVDTNEYALQVMREELPQIVPDAELHCFDNPNHALAFAEAEGCDVLLTEIEFWSERFGGIRLAKEIRKINPCVTSFSSPSATRARSPASCPGFPSAAFSRSLGQRRSWRRRFKTCAIQKDQITM